MDNTLISRHRGNYLWGSFFLSGADGYLQTRDPSSGMVLDEVPWTLGSVDVAATDGRRAGPTWASLDLQTRLRSIHKLRDILDSRRGDIAALISREMGKAAWEARLECSAGVKAIDVLLEQCRHLLAPLAHPTARGLMLRRPMGTVAVVTPFPYPVFVPLQLLLPCLIAGNTVVWNPSSHVPLSSQKLAEAFDSAGFPKGVFSMVLGPGDPVGKKLVLHDAIDMVVGAGDPALGDEVREGDVGRPSWVQTGGKAWAIVCADADLDRAAYEVVTGAFLTAGQRCNGTARVLVEEAIADEFLKRIGALSRSLNIASPTDPDCFSGPLVDYEAKTEFQGTIEAYSARGAHFLAGAGPEARQLSPKLRRKGQAFVLPVVARFDGELPTDLPQPEEIEGPFLLAAVVADAEEAVRAYNAHPFGLAASIFTESESRAEALTSTIRAGCVNWNRGTIVASARFPNAGLGRSGQGAEGNASLLLACTWPQAKLRSAGPFNASQRVPGMEWPDEMTQLDPDRTATPPFRPDDDTLIIAFDD